jgi:type I restriction enzyme R subunit
MGQFSVTIYGATGSVLSDIQQAENILQNYDEFAALQAFQDIDPNDVEAVEAFKEKHYLSDEDLREVAEIRLPSERSVQDYRSTYNDIRDWLRQEKAGKGQEESSIDWDDIVFEVDLLKSQEINLDYILELIFEKNKQVKDKGDLIEEARRIIRASLGHRAKESLLIEFINATDLDQMDDKASVIGAFFAFARAEQQREVEDLINSEDLNPKEAKRYISTSIKRNFASENGDDLNDILPKMSPLNPQFRTKKQSVFQKISALVERFKDVGGKL